MNPADVVEVLQHLGITDMMTVALLLGAWWLGKKVRHALENLADTLAGLVKGQDATNRHLSQLNGTVAKHEEKLSKVALENAHMKGVLGIGLEEEAK